MTALPPVAEVALAAVMVLSVLRAFFGRPPGESDLFAAGAWMLAGVVLLATVVLAGEAARPRDLLCAAAVEAVCVAGWWLRGREDDGGKDDDDGGNVPVEPPPDWDEFDRLRAGWSQPPTPVA